MTFAFDMADMTDELLREFGAPREITLISETATGAEYAPGDPIETEHIIVGVTRLKYLDSTENGTLIDERSREVIMSTKLSSGEAVTVPPKFGDKLNFDGFRWEITSVGSISPGGEVIVYKLEVTR